MGYIRKFWESRTGTNLTKFTKSSETGTSVILTNAPDAITNPGTPVSEDALNNIEIGIEETRNYTSSENYVTTIGNFFGITHDGVNFYICDIDNNKIIKKIISTGVESNFKTGINPITIVYLDGYLYFHDQGDFKIKKIEISSGTMTDIVTGVDTVDSITTDGTYLYIARNTISKIQKITTSGTITDVVTGLTSATRSLTRIDGNLYLVDSSTVLKKIVISTGIISNFATIDISVNITTDGTNLFCTTQYSHKIQKIIVSSQIVSDFRYGIFNKNNYNSFVSHYNNYFYYVDSVDGFIKKVNITPSIFLSPSLILNVNITSGTVVLPDARYSSIRLYGTLAENSILVLPDDLRSYKIINDCTGSYYVTVKTASGTGITSYAYNGSVRECYCDGTNIKQLSNGVKKLTGTTGESEGDVINIAHGLDYTKILHFESYLYISGTSSLVSPAFQYVGGFLYNITCEGNNFTIYMHPTESGNILSKPITITIYYEG